MAYESWNIREREGEHAWMEAGKPVVPSLLSDGRVLPILHVSQLARALALPAPPAEEVTRVGWELASTLLRWLELIRPLGWAELTAATESRGRSLRNLTVNVFHPVELLPQAWEAGRFEWDPAGDEAREGLLQDAGEINGYADRIASAWSSFLLEFEAALRERDPPVSSPRGDVAFSELLASQAQHARFHLEQVEAFLAGRSAT